MPTVPPPGLFSSVLVHTFNELIVQGDQVADQGCGAQARALSPRQQQPEITVEVQVFVTQLSWDLYLSWKTQHNHVQVLWAS